LAVAALLMGVRYSGSSVNSNVGMLFMVKPFNVKMTSKALKTLYNGSTVYSVCYPMPIHCKAF
jgi:hypothetical protein